MLRLIGAVVLIVLVIGPLLLQLGVLEHTGLFRELIELEVKAFSELLDIVRDLIHSREANGG
jgi:hypothetical protein